MIAKYYRLSLADGDLGSKGKDESNSIENQRLLIGRYVESKEEFRGMPTQEYIDDGYTGTNFERPGFDHMMDDVRYGKISIVIVKDMSRFGRDYIGVGDYLEQIFPVLGVRFIAVNNNYDSDKYKGTTMGLDMAIGNYVNSMYSKDIGKKLRTSNISRWKKGYRTSGLPPFGYMKNPETKGRFIPDPEAAEVVRHIFELALEGYNCTQIASRLNDERIPIPSEYYRERGVKGKCSFYKVAFVASWDYSKVYGILKNYEYTGAMIFGKRRTLITGSNVSSRVPESERIIYDGINEAIVTKEVFEKAQHVIRKGNETKFRKENDYPLKGKIRCGTCGKAMKVDFHSHEKRISCAYAGELKMQTGCSPQVYSMKTIEKVIQNSIYSYCQVLIELSEKIERFTQLESVCKNERANTIKELIEQIGILRKDKVRLYESYAEDIISFDTYKAKREEVDAKLISMSEELEGLKKVEAENSESIAPEVCNFIEDAKEIAAEIEVNEAVDEKNKEQSKEEQTEEKQNNDEDKVLTRQMVEKMIESVYIYGDNRMEVRFRFEDEIKAIMERVS